MRGWEKRTYDDHDGVSRDVWVNHETKETSWTPPVEPEYEAWELVTQQVLDIKRCVDKRLLVAYKDLFLVSGDRNAELYTGSAAMHSAQLDLLLVRPSCLPSCLCPLLRPPACPPVCLAVCPLVCPSRPHSCVPSRVLIVPQAGNPSCVLSRVPSCVPLCVPGKPRAGKPRAACPRVNPLVCTACPGLASPHFRYCPNDRVGHVHSVAAHSLRSVISAITTSNTYLNTRPPLSVV